jgi:hypothetical protein
MMSVPLISVSGDAGCSLNVIWYRGKDGKGTIGEYGCDSKPRILFEDDDWPINFSRLPIFEKKPFGKSCPKHLVVWLWLVPLRYFRG